MIKLQYRKRFHPIAAQLFLLFFIGMIVPVLVGGYLSYNRSTKLIEEQVSTVASLTITQVSDKMDLIFKKLDDTSMFVLGSEPIRDVLEEPSGQTDYESFRNSEEAKKYLASLMANSPEIMDIYVFDDERQNSVFGYAIPYTDLWESDWYQSIKDADGRAVWFGLTYDSYLRRSNIGIPVFGLGRAIKSWDTGEIVGVIFIEVRGNTIIEELENVKFGDKGYTYVVDGFNHYIYHPDETLYGKLSNFALPEDKVQRYEEDGRILMIPEMQGNGWYVTGIVSVEELVTHSQEIRNLSIWIAAVSILFAIIMGYYVSVKIGRPLVNLNKLMKRGEAGDLTVRSHITAKNELGQLGNSFNKMIYQIEMLIQRIGTEESQKKMAEIRALRYQINPHFLYNTLNSIRWMAKMNRGEDVVNAISTLVHLLEGSLQRNGPFMELGEELELLKKYMVIQQYRYDNKISLLISCSEELTKIPIPRMLLQPIVENAIFHGIAPKDDVGTIEIDVYRQQSDVVIVIKDDGIGIHHTLIPDLLSVEGETKTRGMTSIGLRHVHQTLQLHYGDSYGVCVTSEMEVGTRVELLVKGEGNHVQSAVS